MTTSRTAIWRRVRWGNVGLLAAVTVGVAMLVASLRGGGGAETVLPVGAAPEAVRRLAISPAPDPAPRHPPSDAGGRARPADRRVDRAVAPPMPDRAVRRIGGRPQVQRIEKRLRSETGSVVASSATSSADRVSAPQQVAAPTTASEPPPSSGEFMPDPGSGR